MDLDDTTGPDGIARRTFAATIIRTTTDTDDQERTVTGIGVPFGQTIDLMPGLRERFEPGACDGDDGALLLAQHTDPIGRIVAGRDTDAGREVTLRFAHTSTAIEWHTLVREGVIDRFSIGFRPREYRTETDDAGTTTIIHTAVDVLEYSLVPFPAYSAAEITNSRSAHQEHHRKDHTVTDQISPPVSGDLDAIRADLADLRRSLVAGLEAHDRPTHDDGRTAGQLVRAALSGDDAARSILERAYTGGTSADGFDRPTWAADLTAIVDEADPLAGMFSTGALPESGMSIEFGHLESNSVKVGKQAEEGDQLQLGKVAVKSSTAPVETYGGAAQLSVQEIRRAQPNMLDMHFRALAVAAGQARYTAKLTKLNALVAANSSSAITVNGGATDWAPWVPAIIAAIKKFRPLGLGVAGIAMPADLWAGLAQLKATDGRPLMRIDGPDENAGVISLTSMTGSLVSVPTRLVDGLTTPAFWNPAAIREYMAPLVRVTNELSALDLTTPIGVYQFGALADEIPGAVVPITIA